MSKPNRCFRFVILQYYCVVAIGAPIPLPHEDSAGATAGTRVSMEVRFPCEGGQCGCNAERCWSSCCCHSLSQRLDWARRHQVTPPQEVLAQASQAGHDVSAWRHDQEKAPGCCGSGTHGGTADAPHADDDCCATHDTVDPSAEASSTHAQNHPASVILIHSLACRGLAYGWSSVTVALLPALPIMAADSTVTAATPFLFGWQTPEPLAPPTPPPRVADSSSFQR